MLEDEAAESAVVRRPFAAQLQHARAAELDPLPEVDLGARAVEQGTLEPLRRAQPVDEVEERDADVGREGQGHRPELRAEAVLRDGIGRHHQR